MIFKTVVFFVNLWKHVYSNNANTFADQIAINIHVCLQAGLGRQISMLDFPTQDLNFSSLDNVNISFNKQ